MDGITLITAVHNRPRVIPILETLISRCLENINCPHQWIIVDDGTDRARPTLGQTHLRLNPSPPDISPGQSMIDNIRMGCYCAKYDRIYFIEDDDWRHPLYLAKYEEWFKRHPEADIIGEAHAKYYYLGIPDQSRYLICPNNYHCSLTQTAIRRSLIDPMIKFTDAFKGFFFDIWLWTQLARRPAIKADSAYCVGLKNVCGSGGVGAGHLAERYKNADPDLSVLRQWIGDDVELYQKGE